MLQDMVARRQEVGQRYVHVGKQEVHIIISRWVGVGRPSQVVCRMISKGQIGTLQDIGGMQVVGWWVGAMMVNFMR